MFAILTFGHFFNLFFNIKLLKTQFFRKYFIPKKQINFIFHILLIIFLFPSLFFTQTWLVFQCLFCCFLLFSRSLDSAYWSPDDKFMSWGRIIRITWRFPQTKPKITSINFEYSQHILTYLLRIQIGYKFLQS